MQKLIFIISIQLGLSLFAHTKYRVQLYLVNGNVHEISNYYFISKFSE